MDYTAFDALLDTILVLDQEKRLIYCNETAAQFLDTPRRRIKLGSLLSNYVVFEEEAELFRIFSDSSHGVTRQNYRELSYVMPKGKSGKARVALHKEANSPFDYWIVYIHDVTLEETLHKKYRSELAQKESVISDLRDAKTQLEDYSKNLEQKVIQRTEDLTKANRLVGAMVDSLGQGFIIFDANGNCLPFYSRACETLLEIKDIKKPIWDVLHVTEAELAGFKDWLALLFAEPIPFVDIAVLGPARFPSTTQKHVTLEYFPMRDDEARVAGVVLVATDKTSEQEAMIAAQRERAHADCVIRFVRGRQPALMFIKKARQIFSELGDSVVATNLNSLEYEQVFRHLHILKGGAAALAIAPLIDLIHGCEELLLALKKSNQSKHREIVEAFRQKANEARASFEKYLRDMKELLGSAISTGERMLQIPFESIETFSRELASDNCSPKIRQMFNDQFVKEDMRDLLIHYDDLIRDAATSLQKTMNPLEFAGKSVRVVARHYSELITSLMHVFRNGVDHGIEPPDDRLRTGKSPAGTMRVELDLVSEKTRKWLVIAITDDGRGVDPEILRKKLREKNIDTASESDIEVLQHVFDAGFSTRTDVSLFSGRGVGMDAVKSAAEKLGGSVEFSSQKHVGSRVTIKVPYIEVDGVRD